MDSLKYPITHPVCLSNALLLNAKMMTLPYFEYGLLDVLAQSLRHAAHVVRHLVHALRQVVGEGLDGVGHVTHGTPQGVHEGVHLCKGRPNHTLAS